MAQIDDNPSRIAPVNHIKTEIEKAKKVDPKDNEGSLAAGMALMNDTKADLELLKELRVEGDSIYQTLVDSLAKQILQCAINYYNGDGSTQYLRVDNAEKLLNYASGIAEGSELKERCRKNMEVMANNKKHFAISANHKSLLAIQEKFKEQPRTNAEAIQLIQDCAPDLEAIKNILGADDPMYLSYSTLVAKNALITMMKEGTNAYKKDASGNRDIPRIKEALKAQWRGVSCLESMDLEAEFADTSLKNYKKGLVDMATIYKTPKQETVQQEKPLMEEEAEDQHLRKMMIIGIVVAVVAGILISMVIF